MPLSTKLDNGVSNTCATFGNKRLSSSEFFKTLNVEVWRLDCSLGGSLSDRPGGGGTGTGRGGATCTAPGGDIRMGSGAGLQQRRSSHAVINSACSPGTHVNSSLSQCELIRRAPAATSDEDAEFGDI